MNDKGFLSSFLNLFKSNNNNNTTINHNSYCSKCGTKINEDIKYCPNCGNRIGEEEEKIILYCPDCGEAFDDNTTICPNCNKLLISIDQDPQFKAFMKEYATVIVLWGYDKPKELIKNGQTPVYYTYECNITNIEMFIKQLIVDGYLRHPNNQELLQTLTIKELKDVLKENGEAGTGNKKDLIDRIIENNINVSLFDRKEEYYIISELGEEFYESHKEYIELHRHQNYRITPREFYEMKKRLLSKGNLYIYRDCIWGIFQNRLLNYSKEKDYIKLHFNYENMANFCYEEGKLNVAVNLYLKCVIYELCGVNFYYEWKWFHDNSYAVEMLKKNIKESIIYCTSMQSLIKCKEFYKNDMLKREYDNLEMNFKLCSLELIEKIINEAMNDSMFNIEEYKELIIRDRLNNLNKYI